MMAAEKLIDHVTGRSHNRPMGTAKVASGYYNLVKLWCQQHGKILTRDEIKAAVLAMPQEQRFSSYFDSTYLSDSCYNTVNKNDKMPKYLLQLDEGQYKFVDTDWQGDTAITWAPKKGKKTIVGHYEGGVFAWNADAMRRAVGA